MEDKIKKSRAHALLFSFQFRPLCVKGANLFPLPVADKGKRDCCAEVEIFDFGYLKRKAPIGWWRD